MVCIPGVFAGDRLSLEHTVKFLAPLVGTDGRWRFAIHTEKFRTVQLQYSERLSMLPASAFAAYCSD
jgi:hypothetical protein